MTRNNFGRPDEFKVEWVPIGRVFVHATSPKAAFLSQSGNEGDAVWFPKSQLSYTGQLNKGTTADVDINRWIAEREGWA